MMIVIEKSKRLLSLYDDGGRLVSSHPVCLGKCPEGPKLSEGDGKTPEGAYRVCTVNPHSKFHLSFGLSYPGVHDARNARREKRISAFTYLKIRVFHLLGLRPPWNTPLGGFIMLHGESPSGEAGDWTQGCIALENEAIDAVGRHIKKGDTVKILP